MCFTLPSHAAGGWLGDALDVVTQQLVVALGAPLAEPLPTLASARHGLIPLDTSNLPLDHVAQSPIQPGLEKNQSFF